MQIKILFYENKYSMIALSRVKHRHQILQNDIFWNQNDISFSLFIIACSNIIKAVVYAFCTQVSDIKLYMKW